MFGDYCGVDIVWYCVVCVLICDVEVGGCGKCVGVGD